VPFRVNAPQVTASDYRNPAATPGHRVLVVGASASGLQIARELAVAGRDVVLAVGSHTRVPRRYRGRDLYSWLAATGSLDRCLDDLPDPVAARSEPSLQLAGGSGDLDLGVLRTLGVRLAGRLAPVSGSRARFADDLTHTVAAADVRLRRVLASIDVLADAQAAEASEPIAPIRIARPLRALDLRGWSVLWAAGYHRRYPWLRVPVLDAGGEVRHERGVTPVPALYVLGQRFQHYRSSHFIHGVGRDAAFVADHIAA
jgi:putative flavoprotein involved in K+ transport